MRKAEQGARHENVVVRFNILFGLYDFRIRAGDKVWGASSPGKSPAVVKSIPLTPDEEKDILIDQLKTDKLQLQIDKLQSQVNDASQKRARETARTLPPLAKAHDVDLTKYRLDPQVKAFVPIPPAEKPKTPAAEKK